MFLRFGLIIVSYFTVSTAFSYEVYPGCAVPASSGKVWYVDSASGQSPAEGGDGSAQKPWSSLNAIISGDWAKSRAPLVPGYPRPLLSTVPYLHVVDGKWQNLADDQGAPPVHPGDQILLASGSYGDLSLGAYQTPTVNSDFVVVKAAPGAVPQFATLTASATSKWVFDGLRVQSPVNTSGAPRSLLTVGDQGPDLQTHDLIFANLTIRSIDSVTSLTRDQLAQQLRYGVSTRSTTGDGTNGAPNTTCLSIVNSRISNVRTGAMLVANRFLFASNEIDHFFDDGIVYAANDLIIARNFIHDNGDIGDGNHEDAMQGQAGFAPPNTYNKFSNILIDGNRIFRQLDPQMPFPTYLQGISNFDAEWTDWRATNNVVVTSGCWGIWSGSAHNSLIASNTVAEDGLVVTPGCHPLVTLGGKTHQGSHGDHDFIVNNIAPQISLDNKGEPTVVWANNISFTNLISYDAAGNAVFNNKKGTDANNNLATSIQPAAMFRLWDPSRLIFDVTPQWGSPAIGIGVVSGAPSVDILGKPRTAPLTVGAYGYPF